MFEIFFSRDVGLLDHKAKEFRLHKLDVRVIRNPDLYELQHFLAGRDVNSGINSCLVEGFKGQLHELDEFVSRTNLSDQNIMVLIRPEEDFKPPKDPTIFQAVSFIEIPILNEKTKRSFLNRVLQLYGIRLESQLSNFVKDRIPPDALVINEFINRLSLLEEEDFSEQLLLELLDLSSLDANFFQFGDLFLEQSNEGLEFFNNHVLGIDSLRKCFHIVAGKATEFKIFIDYKTAGESMDDAEKELSIKKYTMYEIEKIWRNYGSEFPSGINELILNLCFFQKHLNYSYSSSISLFRLFLLKQKMNLKPC